jgi:hypothetical protein
MRKPDIKETWPRGMVRPERFELPTYSSGGCRSIQLSYGRMPLVYIGTGDLLFSRQSEQLRAASFEL